MKAKIKVPKGDKTFEYYLTVSAVKFGLGVVCNWFAAFLYAVCSLAWFFVHEFLFDYLLSFWRFPLVVFTVLYSATQLNMSLVERCVIIGAAGAIITYVCVRRIRQQKSRKHVANALLQLQLSGMVTYNSHMEFYTHQDETSVFVMLEEEKGIDQIGELTGVDKQIQRLGTFEFPSHTMYALAQLATIAFTGFHSYKIFMYFFKNRFEASAYMISASLIILCLVIGRVLTQIAIQSFIEDADDIVEQQLNDWRIVRYDYWRGATFGHFGPYGKQFLSIVYATILVFCVLLAIVCFIWITHFLPYYKEIIEYIAARIPTFQEIAAWCWS